MSSRHSRLERTDLRSVELTENSVGCWSLLTAGLFSPSRTLLGSQGLGLNELQCSPNGQMGCILRTTALDKRCVVGIFECLVLYLIDEVLRSIWALGFTETKNADLKTWMSKVFDYEVHSSPGAFGRGRVFACDKYSTTCLRKYISRGLETRNLSRALPSQVHYWHPAKACKGQGP